MLWRWLNAHVIVEALSEVTDPDTREHIEAALDRILEAPLEPERVLFHRLEDISGDPPKDTFVAWLPHDFFITYRPYLAGPPPYAGKHIVVMSMRHIDDVTGEMED